MCGAFVAMRWWGFSYFSFSCVGSGFPVLRVSNGVGEQLEHYCFECHDNDTQKGKVNLQVLADSGSMATQYYLWKKVASVLRTGDMPPQKADQPGEVERGRIVDGIKIGLDGIDWSKVKQAGHVTIPRLNHLEYRNSLRDLLGWDLNPGDRFPGERVGETGYSTDRDVLVIEDALLETYLDVADSVLEDFIHGDAPPQTTKARFGWCPPSRFGSPGHQMSEVFSLCNPVMVWNPGSLPPARLWGGLPIERLGVR
jgi:hypothetical protein